MKTINTIFVKMVVVFTLLSLIPITGASFLLVGRYTMHFRDYFKCMPLLLLFGTIVLFMFLFGFFLCIEKSSDVQFRWIKVALIVVLLALQIILLYCFDVRQVTDPYWVNEQAWEIATGRSSVINSPKGYFAAYSNNYFVVVAIMWFYKILHMFGITNYSMAFEILNTILIDLSVVFTYKTVKLFVGEKTAVKVLLFLVCNPLNYFFIFYYYTTTYSMPLMILLVYLCAQIKKSGEGERIKNLVRCIGVALICVIGYFLRPTVLIPFIAVVICFFLTGKITRKNILTLLLYVCVFMVSAGISYKVVYNEVYQYVEDTSGNFPMTHWIMMALHGDMESSKDADRAYTRSFKTKEEKREANIIEIKRTLKEYGGFGLLRHLAEKPVVTWSDGGAGYNIRMGDDRKLLGIYDWITGERADFTMFYCWVYRVVTLMLAFISVFGQLIRKKYDYRFLFTLTLFGGIAFYLLWEGKSVYSIPFLSFLVVLSMDGMQLICDWLEKKKLSEQKRIVYSVAAILVCVTLISGIRQYDNFVVKEYEWNDYSVTSGRSATHKKEILISKNGGQIEQEFYTSKAFNTVSIGAKQIKKKNSTYVIKLLAENEELKVTSVSAKDISDGFICIDVGEQKPEGEECYRLVIAQSDPNQKESVKWSYQKGKSSDIYKGYSYLNGEQREYDIFINVYENYSGAYLSKIIYILIILTLILSEVVISLWIVERRPI